MFQRLSTSQLTAAQDNQPEEKLSRRSALLGLGGLGAMAGLAACSSPSDAAQHAAT